MRYDIMNQVEFETCLAVLNLRIVDLFNKRYSSIIVSAETEEVYLRLPKISPIVATYFEIAIKPELYPPVRYQKNQYLYRREENTLDVIIQKLFYTRTIESIAGELYRLGRNSKLRKVTLRKPKKPQRKRGYDDKGSLLKDPLPRKLPSSYERFYSISSEIRSNTANNLLTEDVSELRSTTERTIHEVGNHLGIHPKLLKGGGEKND